MILLDSSFLVAVHNQNDAHHRDAVAIMPDLVAGKWGQAILPEYVFLEVVTVLLARRGQEVAMAATSILLEAKEVDFVPCSGLFEATLAVFRAQSGRNLSFTDAAIIALARDRTIPYLATFDRDFTGIDGLALIPEAN